MKIYILDIQKKWYLEMIVFLYEMKRKRKEFGRQCIFSEQAAELSTDIPADPAYMRNYTIRNPIHVEVQVGPELSEHEVTCF